MVTLSVEVQALVSHASYRYDDSLICDGLRHFARFAANVPDSAWGQMPWSRRWAQDWESATSARVREAQTASDLQSETGSKLSKVAANYSHTEISTKLSAERLLSKENSFLLPWIQASEKGQGSISTAPGHTPRGPNYANTPDLPYQIPPGDPGPDVNPNEPKNRIMFASADHDFDHPFTKEQGHIVLADRALMVLGNTAGRAALNLFLNANEHYIQDAQNIVRTNGAATSKMPLDDFIQDVRFALPGAIQNRAELFNALSNEYGELSTEMTTQTNGLKSSWQGPGAEAYGLHADRCIKYFDTLKEQAAWVGSEGCKAAHTVDSLQYAYAQAGNAKVGNLITALRAYKDAAAGFTKGSTQEPLALLVDALSAMANAFFAKWQQANADAGEILKIDQKASDTAPNLGDGTHRPQSFPSEAGAAPYDDSSHWKQS
ncbi:hypothetical protein GCM10023196_093230 [Actinoallomurus vinaceus]|uniref:ESX-1 secretion-associated protein EspA/EspE-like domain-containing protein n=1 Tax=Actinoallomurus vinaceus TaxID=1080074 RepID=A0ABP8USY8_9ACTN